MEKITVKVNDRVRWSGEYPLNIHGLKKKEWIEFCKEKRKSPSFNFDEFLKENTVLVFKKGVGKIKSIYYDDIFGEKIIELYNGKIFLLESVGKNIKLVKSKIR